ncbi:hypothetical protein AJ79_04247 [Helicocarpus griseus UAMH5409]|uniref:Cytidyltransferase-like domain-containing protein n=1 Tax=Helicocarpus griseus UAMH5409 TaxID=1447875 RepID=A0A2B7XUR0_9EURO|nr:hypothetical protein AJ79_04247 [Helicocarpus griseus UAMH5409]
MAAGTPSRHEALLLLPGTPSTTYASLKAAYGPALSVVLAELSTPIKGTSGKAVLDIAIAARGLAAPDSAPRGRAFAHLQQLLASFYRLLGVTSLAHSVDLDGPGGVDARVFFIDDDAGGDSDAIQSITGPIIRLADFAVSGRSWQAAFSLGTREGDVLLDALTQTLKQQGLPSLAPAIRKLPGLTGSLPPQLVLENPELHRCRHYSVAVGGTFDHLHAGHKLLLTATALAIDAVPPGSEQPVLRTITIGITGDELLVNKKYAEVLESWDERWQGVWTFMKSILDFAPSSTANVTANANDNIEHVNNPGPNGKYVLVKVSSDLQIRLVQISDPFGPTITDEAISALVVSKETRSGGKAVNDEREKKGWPKLEVFEVDVLDVGEIEVKEGDSAENFESKISSTEIRRRQMNLAKGNL